MPPLKQIIRSQIIQSAICWILAGYIRLIWLTSRWRVMGAHVPAEYWDGRKPFILAFWHGRLMMMPYCWRRGMKMNMLISRHRDGGLIAGVIRHFGLGAVRGSSAKPGKNDKSGGGALRAIIRLLSCGEYAGVTPDGPRGPAMRVGGGVLAMARLSGAPIIPVTFAASPRIHVNSWDRFLVPLPFGRGVFIWGNPLTVPRDADDGALDQARQMLENDLIRITREADDLCGHGWV
jgi:lysophospholipid acyltransferase (LPLAT)-like uncharacterized protein